MENMHIIIITIQKLKWYKDQNHQLGKVIIITIDLQKHIRLLEKIPTGEYPMRKGEVHSL